MHRRPELYLTRSRPVARSAGRNALLACAVLGVSTLAMSAGGCQLVKERRAQRAAEREARAQARAQAQAQSEAGPQASDRDADRAPAQGRGDRSLPVSDPGGSQAHNDWLERQQMARDPAAAQDPGSGPGGTSRAGMEIIDERPVSARIEPGEVEIAGEQGGVFTKRSKEETSYNRAVELHASGDLEQAISELERAIAFNPQFIPAYIEAGDIYLEMGDYEQAERKFALAVRTQPRNFMAQYRHAQVLDRLGRLDEANRAYLRALSIRPADFDANLGISIVMLEMGRAEQALSYGQRAVKSDPPSGRARMHLGNVYAAIDRHEDAIVEYQQAAELMDAPTPGLLLNMAESLNQLQRYAEMVGALDQLVRMDPGPIAYERLGSGLFRLRRYDESLDAFKKSAELDPRHYPAYNGVAVCELNAYLWSSKTDGGARERAVEAMRQSLKIEPAQPRIVELLRRYGSASGTEK